MPSGRSSCSRAHHDEVSATGSGRLLHQAELFELTEVHRKHNPGLRIFCSMSRRAGSRTCKGCAKISRSLAYSIAIWFELKAHCDSVGRFRRPAIILCARRHQCGGGTVLYLPSRLCLGLVSRSRCGSGFATPRKHPCQRFCGVGETERAGSGADPGVRRFRDPGWSGPRLHKRLLPIGGKSPCSGTPRLSTYPGMKTAHERPLPSFPEPMCRHHPGAAQVTLIRQSRSGTCCGRPSQPDRDLFLANRAAVAPDLATLANHLPPPSWTLRTAGE